MRKYNDLTLSKMDLSTILKIFLVFEVILIRILIKNDVLYATKNFTNKLLNSTLQFRGMRNIRNITFSNIVV